MKKTTPIHKFEFLIESIQIDTFSFQRPRFFHKFKAN